MKKIVTAFLIIIAIGAIIIFTYYIDDSLKDKAAVERYSDTVTKYSFMFNVDGNLVFAVIKAESGFDKYALSKKGAIGLMQILPSTAQFIAKKLNEDFNESLLYDHDINIKYGTYYLSYLKEKFEDFDCMLAAYNAGEGNVRYWLEKLSDDGIHLKQIPFKETENYVIKVKTFYNSFKQKYRY